MLRPSGWTENSFIPGLISAHSHLGLCQGAAGPQPDHYNRQNVQHQLEQYERYGVTSVLSLGCNADVLYTWKEPKNKAAAAMGQRNLRTIFEAGVTVAMGTDSSALPTRIPGFAEHRELQLMVQAGLSPMQALVCATKNSARAIGVDDRGTLEPGKQADFVVLNADPQTDIAHTTQIAFVVHRGNIVKR